MGSLGGTTKEQKMQAALAKGPLTGTTDVKAMEDALGVTELREQKAAASPQRPRLSGSDKGLPGKWDPVSRMQSTLERNSVPTIAEYNAFIDEARNKNTVRASQEQLGKIAQGSAERDAVAGLAKDISNTDQADIKLDIAQKPRAGQAGDDKGTFRRKARNNAYSSGVNI